MSITFPVDKVEPSKHGHIYVSSPEYKQKFFEKALVRAGIKAGTVEAHAMNYEDVQLMDASQNSFVHTALNAFSDHAAFAIAPDDIWLLIVQAVSNHIRLNPEDCRKALVNWDGKKTIEVKNNDFIKGSPDNDWLREFADFATQIKELIGKKADLFNPTFTTTGPIEQAAIQVQMMAALAPYFEYRMMTCCGVPSVTLLGEPSDWAQMLAAVNAFGEFYPKWALDPMTDAVANFVKASIGKPDLTFWQNFFKRSYGSGGTRVNGWIGAFFPYMDDKPNKMMYQRNFGEVVVKGPDAGYDVGSFPSSVGTAPMIWNYLGTEYKMALVSGMLGCTSIETEGGKAYKTVIGWAVGESSGPRPAVLPGDGYEYVE
jgi:hypothetical protein